MASVLKERPWWSAGCRSVSDRELCEGIADDFHVVFPLHHCLIFFLYL